MTGEIRTRRGHLMVAIALAAAGIALGSVTSLQVARGEPGVWDIEQWDRCTDATYLINDPDQYWKAVKACCINSGGVWDDAKLDCRAPSGDSQGTRQLPGNVQIPSGIATAPVVTQAPPRPIQVPSDIATAPAVTQTPDCPPEAPCVPPPVP